MAKVESIKHVTVCGGGVMGSGIAQVTACAGYNVTVIEINEEQCTRTRKTIEINLLRSARREHKSDISLQRKFVSENLNRISVTTAIAATIKETDFVIECIVEILKEKHDLFQKIDKIAPPHTIFVTNTSTLLVTDIARPVQRKDRFGGLHFFNPVPINRLVEVIRSENTSNETHLTIKAFADSLGKVAIVCKDTPGFVVNRLLIPYQAQAMKLADEGVSTIKDIDIAMKLSLGYPMGPFELTDLVGLDTSLNIQKIWHEREPNNPLFVPSPILAKLVDQGKLGLKTGEGFYKYNNMKST